MFCRPQAGGGRMVTGAGNLKKAPEQGLSSVTSKQSLSDLRQQSEDSLFVITL